ncbi:MAG: BMP family ABC transporter substrate-binding protein [Candidatus Bipolaricaulaceae bacterium]
MKRILAVVLAVVALGALAFSAEKIKAGFIYVGPIGDYGWTHAHDLARRIVDEKFDWLETVYVESVPEGEVETYIDQLVRQGCNVIFTTSFGFMDGTLAAAQRYPNVIFAHCSGFKRWANMATYMADFYQVYYLNGLMAGALTQTGKIGYVAAFPIPEVKRHISAFTIGVREVNPTAEVHVRWIYEWFNPAAAKEAAEALLAEGCDVFAFTEDSPTVVQVAAEKDRPSFGHYSPMYEFAPDYVVSGQIVHWEKIYEDFLVKIHEGIYTTKNLAHVDYWWTLPQGAVEVGAKPGMIINPKFEEALKSYVIDHPAFGKISVYDLVFIRLSQMSDPGITFDPFQGPVYDRKGNLRVPAGLWMSYDALTTMEWAVAGVVGPWPKEP